MLWRGRYGRLGCCNAPVIERCRTKTRKAENLPSISGKVPEPVPFGGRLPVDSDASRCLAQRAAPVP